MLTEFTGMGFAVGGALVGLGLMRAALRPKARDLDGRVAALEAKVDEYLVGPVLEITSEEFLEALRASVQQEVARMDARERANRTGVCERNWGSVPGVVGGRRDA